ncbi:IS3 family transposase [Saccharopolyspora sp. ASAGF58]|uniref:IS3 family transposase n=1 Tax=Saccharopolyspora sp. ASAGF58 TaxID=2719023 RepID=UPI00143FFDD9|nr:IS3 family transposase [Saccharopolyspora sp. ASAGF58]QIZ33923.1 hypothetical protein FDZ84_03200 [Saccharopolyspora sp. ASAGF58]
MAGPSSLTEEQRAAAIELFDDGWARRSVATRLGVSVWAVGRLYDLWRVRGGAALVRKPSKRSFSFEFKLEVTLDDYITWFNTSRGHTHCEVLSPVQYRTQTLAA